MIASTATDLPNRRLAIARALQAGWLPLADVARLCGISRQRLHQIATQQANLRVRRQTLPDSSKPLLLLREADAVALLESRGQPARKIDSDAIHLRPLRLREERFEMERQGYVTLMDAAEKAGVKQGRLRAAIRRGELACKRIPRPKKCPVFVRMKDVEAYLASAEAYLRKQGRL